MINLGKLETVILILAKLPNVVKDIADGINAKNISGKTALFYAKDSQVMYLLLHYGADPCIISTSKSESVLESYMRTNPENAIALINYDVDTNGRETTDHKFVYTYNFRLLLNRKKIAATDEALDKEEKMDKIDVMEIQGSSWQLRNAPIAEFYLRLKWIMYKKAYYLSLFIFLLYLISLTTMTFSTSYWKNHLQNDTNNTGCTIMGFYHNQDGLGFWPWYWVTGHISTSLCTLTMVLSEVFELKSIRTQYFKIKENWLQMLMLSVSIAYLILVSLTGDAICVYEQYLGSLTLFLAWIEMTIMVGRIPSVKIYIIMFLKIFKQLLMVFSVYSTTMIAFACAYTIILPKSKIFENPISSFIKVIVMMIGESDFQANFISQSTNHSNETMPTKLITQGIFVAFLFIVTLTLNNLIIGLTVDKIGELLKELRTSDTTLDHIKNLEGLFHNKHWFNRLVVKIIVKSAELFQCFRASSKFNVLTPKDIIHCKNDFQVCVQRDFSKDLHDSSHLMYSNFDVYFYDAQKKEKGQKIDMVIPEWIVKNTEKGNSFTLNI